MNKGNINKTKENTTAIWSFDLKSFQDRLSETQKKLLAGGFSLLIMVLVGGGIFAYLNPNTVNNLINLNRPTETAKSENKGTSPTVAAAAENLNRLFSKVTEDSLVYQIINFEELPIYPKAWQERYFDSKELLNSLISGPGADLDRDGLSNKQEDLYGSDPKNNDSLCSGKIDGGLCKGKSDGENVADGVSPLTGTDLETPRKIKIKKQDLAVVTNLQSSFETAAKEGVDFPTLYQLSKTIDLSSELESKKVLVEDETAKGILEYQEFRVGVLGEFAEDDEFSSFTKIYELSKPEEFDLFIKKYAQIKEKLAGAIVPRRYERAHKSYILLFDKLVALVEHRKSGVMAGSVGNEFKEKSRRISTEMVWSYRRLNEELVRVSQLNRSNN